jgi:adapter protein MecA 1/2
MKIERIDDKTVKCFLSNEEMEEYQIDYKDFIMRSDKAKEMVREIIEQAEEEVGYRPPQFAFDLQIMLLQDKGLVLTLSEKEPFDNKDSERILEFLKEMKNMIFQTKDKIGQNLNQGIGTIPVQDENGQNVVETALPRIDKPDYAVFVFDRIGDIIDFANVMPKGLRVASVLYVVDDRYYLYIGKATASYERYSRACVQATEFGSLYTADEDVLRYMIEHGECIIEEKALKKLRLG